MDKILQITIGIFIFLLIGFITVCCMNTYIENEYLATLSGSYTYSTTITTDSPLSNITLFIPVPEDRAGNSPIISVFSAGTIDGMPPNWTSTLYYTGKSTVAKITAPLLMPPAQTTPETPFSVTLTINTSSKNHLETLDPADKGVVYRPVQELMNVSCKTKVPVLTGSEHCNEYITSIYADYLSSPNASVSISSDLAGKNSWNIFGPHSNEYCVGIMVNLTGENHGWSKAKGVLSSGIGVYDEPAGQT